MKMKMKKLRFGLIDVNINDHRGQPVGVNTYKVRLVNEFDANSEIEYVKWLKGPTLNPRCYVAGLSHVVKNERIYDIHEKELGKFGQFLFWLGYY